MRGTNRIAKLPVGVRGQIISLRQAGRSCLEICERLGLDKASERKCGFCDMQRARLADLRQEFRVRRAGEGGQEPGGGD